MTTYRLIAIAGPHAGQEFALQPGENVVGRDPTMPVCLQRDETVSRRHAVVTIGPTGALVRDLESRNGTVMNGVRVHAAVPLPTEAVLQVGSSAFRLTQAVRKIEIEPPHIESGFGAMIADLGDTRDPRWQAALGYLGNLLGVPLFLVPLSTARKMRVMLPVPRAAPGTTMTLDPRIETIRFLEFHGLQARLLWFTELILSLLLAVPALMLVLIPLVLGARGLGWVLGVLGIGAIAVLALFFTWANITGLINSRRGVRWAAPLSNLLLHRPPEKSV